MFWLGLFASTASIPGVTSISIPAGWAALSLTLPWFAGRGSMTPLHAILGIFLAYVALSISWTTVSWGGAWALWQLAIFGLAFHLGSRLVSLRRLWQGLGIGGAISSAIGIAQWFSPNIILQYNALQPAGFHYSPSVQGMVLVLVAVALATERLWLWIIPLLPGIWLTESRGAFVVLALGLGSVFVRSRALLVIAALSLVFYVTLSLRSDEYERLVYLQAALANLAWFGNGAGSFNDLWVVGAPNVMAHPIQVHNDYVQLIFEYGPGAIPFFLAMGAGLSLRSALQWPILAAFALFATFTFPLYIALAQFVFAVALGHVSASWDLSWARLASRGPHLLSWLRNPQPARG